MPEHLTSTAKYYSELTIILPTLNEAGNITALLAELSQRHPGGTIIVADDGSTDGTGELVLLQAQNTSQADIHLLDRRNCRDHGLTGSVLHALNLVDTPYFVVMDADYQHPPATVRRLFQELQRGKELVVAHRDSLSALAFHRQLLSATGNWIIRRALAGPLRCRDPLSGFFAGRTSTIRPYCRSGFRPQGFKILLALLLQLPDSTAMADIGYSFHSRVRGQSKLGLREAWCDLAALVEHYSAFLGSIRSGSGTKTSASVSARADRGHT